MSSVQETIFASFRRKPASILGKISLDSTLKDLEIQSLDACRSFSRSRTTYKITLPDRDPNFDTESVKGLVDAVERLVAEKQNAATAPSAWARRLLGGPCGG
jgi:hypothetical protein